VVGYILAVGFAGREFYYILEVAACIPGILIVYNQVEVS